MLFVLFDRKKNILGFLVVIFNKSKFLLVLKFIWKVLFKFLYEGNFFLIILKG